MLIPLLLKSIPAPPHLNPVPHQLPACCSPLTLQLGDAAGVRGEASSAVDQLRERLRGLAGEAARAGTRPRVLILQSVKPLVTGERLAWHGASTLLGQHLPGTHNPSPIPMGRFPLGVLCVPRAYLPSLPVLACPLPPLELQSATGALTRCSLLAASTGCSSPAARTGR